MNEQFGVGSVLGMSFRVYARNFIAFTLITAVLYIPLLAWTVHISNAHIDHTSLKEVLVQLGVVLGLTAFLNSFVTATLTYGVVKDLQGQARALFRASRWGSSACCRRSASACWPVSA